MKHKPIHIPPFIRKIGRKTYVVESWFDPEAKHDLTDKMKRLIDQDIRTLQNPPAELTSNHDPDRFG